MDMELGITTFAETTPDPATGETVSARQRLADLLEEIELADRLGLEVYGVGEHHRSDFAVSSPAVVLGAAAVLTRRIRLTSAVSVLSSDDPVRVFQQFATVDLLSGGRAEIMAGRGSFIESYPLFGQDLDDYNELFSEKLDLLLALRAGEKVTWSGSGRHRASLHNLGVYPRPLQDPLPVWIAVGGTPQSVDRAGSLGLPLLLAIIGGQPARFAPLVDLYHRAAERAGADQSELRVGVHCHGYVADSTERAIREFYPSYAGVMTQLGRERGWPPMDRLAFEQMRRPDGSLVLGTPQEVAEKILYQHELLGLDRFLLHISVGTMPHEHVMRSIELFATEVAPIVREEIARRAGAATAS
jgi:probable LLM family oxidoreductase